VADRFFRRPSGPPRRAVRSRSLHPLRRALLHAPRRGSYREARRKHSLRLASAWQAGGADGVCGVRGLKSRRRTAASTESARSASRSPALRSATMTGNNLITAVVLRFSQFRMVIGSTPSAAATWRWESRRSSRRRLICSPRHSGSTATCFGFRALRTRRANNKMATRQCANVADKPDRPRRGQRRVLRYADRASSRRCRSAGQRLAILYRHGGPSTARPHEAFATGRSIVSLAPMSVSHVAWPRSGRYATRYACSRSALDNT
jgi:hypothetical protein